MVRSGVADLERREAETSRILAENVSEMLVIASASGDILYWRLRDSRMSVMAGGSE